jgi:hypothetical protein
LPWQALNTVYFHRAVTRPLGLLPRHREAAAARRVATVTLLDLVAQLVKELRWNRAFTAQLCALDQVAEERIRKTFIAWVMTEIENNAGSHDEAN